MITGDNEFAAKKIASHLKIDPRNVVSRAYPKEKLEKVARLQEKGEIVMFIGDGVNDSPVLAQANVGVAINSQSDITADAANVVLMKDSLYDIIDTLELTAKSFRRIKYNFIWAFGYNIVLIPIAMGILYPFFSIRLPPWLAATAMAASSISVVLSSLLLKTYRKFSDRREGYAILDKFTKKEFEMGDDIIEESNQEKLIENK